MSANIYWRPGEGGVNLPVNSPSAFIAALSLPATFMESDIKFLRGVAAGNPSFAEAIEDLIAAIDRHKVVEVYAVY